MNTEEGALPPIPDQYIMPNWRVKPDFFFPLGQPAKWLQEIIETSKQLKAPPVYALPHRVTLSPYWWERDGFEKAEEWLRANATGPWMPWITGDGKGDTAVAIYFRRVTDAVHFRLAMPEGT